MSETDRDRVRTRLTLRQYHAYRPFPRRTEFNTIFRADRLFQQYMVDAAANIEPDVDHYKGVQDYLATAHVGSERAMRAAFIMAVTGLFKKPHPFITMTSNPKWAETPAEAGIDEPRRFGDPHLQAEEAADARRDLQGP
jgi:hypothetical protein